MVAVKIINIDDSDNANPRLADTFADIMKEIAALKVLSETKAKNINLVIDALPVGKSMWMVTEYCAGGSISTLVSLGRIHILAAPHEPNSVRCVQHQRVYKSASS